MYSPKDLETFLEMAGNGCISGDISGWPQLKLACRYAISKIQEFRDNIDLLETTTRDLLVEIKQFRSEVESVREYNRPS